MSGGGALYASALRDLVSHPEACPVRESDITDLELFFRSLPALKNDQRGLELESL